MGTIQRFKLSLAVALVLVAASTAGTKAQTFCEQAGHSCHVIINGVTHHLLEVI